MKTTTFSPDLLEQSAGRVATTPKGSPGAVTRLAQWLRAALDARRTRHELAQLDPHILRDIGLGDDEFAQTGRSHSGAPGKRHS